MINLKHSVKKIMKSIVGDRFAGGRIRKKHVFSLLKSLNPNGKNFLDAGCGYGDYSFFLSKFPGASVRGIDKDPSMIDWCIKKNTQLGLSANVDFFVQSLPDKLGNEIYDMIVCVDVLDDIPEDDETLEMFYKSLKAYGYLILHVPLAGKPIYLQSTAKFRYELSVRQYEPHNIEEKLIKAGFQINTAKYTFGLAGSLARELWYYAWQLKKSAILKIMIHPLVMMLTLIDVNFPIPKGRGYLLVCEKL